MLERLWREAWILCAVLIAAMPAIASDGVIEINQACAQSSAGCFPGSTSGFALVVINDPGSYRLTGNLTAAANVAGIVIQASDVTLDLGGFSISGPGAGAGTGLGVWLYGTSGKSIQNIEIRNGTIRGFRTGVWVEAEFVEVVRVLDLRAVQNELYGLLLQATSSLVRGCTVTDNTGVGIRGFPGSSALNNVVYNNGGLGMNMNGMAYGGNMIYANNGGNANPQIGTSGGVQLGANQCGNAACP